MTTLHRQLLSSSFLVGAPPLVLAAVVSLWVATEQISAGLEDRLLAGARGAELALDTQLDSIRARSAALARDPDLVTALVEARQAAVLGTAEHALSMIDVDRVTVVDATGRVLARGHAPTDDGDFWAETDLPRSGRSWAALGKGSLGISFEVAAPISDGSHQIVAWLVAQKAVDYATLLDLRRQFGLEFSVWDGDRLQATTLHVLADLREAEHARQQLAAPGKVQHGEAFDFARASFEQDGLGPGTLLLGIDTRRARTLEQRLSLLYLAVALGTIGLTMGGAYLSARRIVRPIRGLTDAADAAAKGQLDVTLAVAEPREIQELSESFRHMLHKRREAEDELRRIHAELERRVAARTEALRVSEEQLRQSRQLEALGRLAGGVAHDFNNVLTVIGGNAELLAFELEALEAPESVHQGVSDIQQGARHAAEIIRQLMAFSRQQVAEPVVLELGQVVRDLEKMLRRLCTEDITLTLEVDSVPVRVLADPTQIGQVLVNLTVNAQDALPTGGNVRIRVYSVVDDAGADPSTDEARSARLEVSDDGVGMDAETARRIFEPFFTTKAPGKGTGLGLATVHGIVTQSGGQIEVVSDIGQGTTFRISFPPAPAESAPRARSTEPAIPRGRETILVCEDEAGVRELTTHFLRSGGYNVLVAGSGRDALAAAAQRGEIDLLVTDVVMPEMNGVQLARRLRDERPELKVLYLSGYTATVIDSRTDMGAKDELLAKPFTRAELLRRVRRAIDRSSDASGGTLKTRG
ncbi:MAG TPA: ATP-binding protein [Polyangiaceae bacterium]|nr:ATP-binding protein [Polyangiaceae bacterium]